MIKIDTQTLNEIIKDFLSAGFEIDLDSFKDWLGLNLDEKSYEYVAAKIYS